MTGRVDWLFWDESFVVEMVVENYYEWWWDNDRVDDGFLPFTLERDGDEAVARIPLPEDVALTDITELRLGSEWKIDGISLVTPQP